VDTPASIEISVWRSSSSREPTCCGGLETDLPAAVCGTHPGLVDGDHPSAEGHLRGLAAVTYGPTPGIVAALWGDDFGDFNCQELGEDIETHVDGRREQAIAAVGGEDLELAFDLLGERIGQTGALEVDEPETRNKAQVRSRGALRV